MALDDLRRLRFTWAPTIEMISDDHATMLEDRYSLLVSWVHCSPKSLNMNIQLPQNLFNTQNILGRSIQYLVSETVFWWRWLSGQKGWCRHPAWLSAFITRRLALLSPQPPKPTSVKRRQSHRANLDWSWPYRSWINNIQYDMYYMCISVVYI